jgi:hypothetical protein
MVRAAILISALALVVLIFETLGARARADDFDRYTNSVLGKVPMSEGAAAVEQLSLAELLKAKPVIAQESGCFVVLRTDEGNWAKIILRPSYRKHAEGEVPLLVIERYQCMRPGTESGRLSAGKQVYLFDGFRFNVDIGQVVPEGDGGDIAFQRDGSSGHVRAVGKVKMYLVTKPLVEVAAGAAGGPSAGPVVADDFAGRFHVVASGKWSGQLSLKVTNSGEVAGSYVSDQTGADYPVRGFVARPTHRIKFTVELPMAQQEFDGFLWTQGKNAIAGTMTLAGNTFGFVAVREGTELSPRLEK